MPKNNRGQIRVTEAFLSALIIFSALAICSAFSPHPYNGDQKTLTAQGMQALLQLDNGGMLARMIDQNNWTALSNMLQLSLPVGVAYNLTVYDEDMQQINNAPISNGNLAGNVVVVEYLCASQGLRYRSYMLRLQLSVVK
ncbi:MAG: hypothetical protein ACQXXH_04040 [Candidatus Bathyarchaeia archaeon]|jgi:hypothetical protein|nr:hypothetical protein [Candidatus Bathyarchaeota archaeon A05DMB-4]MDH7594909.1 hypothetical protein [Candidatus Bathyarchaeota archaeon]